MGAGNVNSGLHAEPVYLQTALKFLFIFISVYRCKSRYNMCEGARGIQRSLGLLKLELLVMCTT